MKLAQYNHIARIVDGPIHLLSLHIVCDALWYNVPIVAPPNEGCWRKSNYHDLWWHFISDHFHKLPRPVIAFRTISTNYHDLWWHFGPFPQTTTTSGGISDHFHKLPRHLVAFRTISTLVKTIIWAYFIEDYYNYSATHSVLNINLTAPWKNLMKAFRSAK